MYSQAFRTLGKTLPLRRTPAQLGQHVGLTRTMSVSLQETGTSVSVDNATPPLATGDPTITPVNVDVSGATQGRRKKHLPKRAPISNASPRSWCRPLGQGVLPAYDLALELLKADSAQIKSETEVLRAKINATEQLRADEAKRDGEGALAALAQLDSSLEALRQKLRILEVQGEINMPDVRWRVANAMPDMNKAVDRHLIEQKWRRNGDLDLLMERIYQMKVVPDLISDLHPSIDIRITANTLGLVPDKAYKVIEPGTFLLPRQTFDPPKIYANVFHTDTRLYTLLLLDADVPDEANASYTTYLHWMQPNVPLSANHTSRIINLNNHTQYIPPHPQLGTGYHRYVLFLLQQPPAGASKYSLNIESRAIPGEPTSLNLDIPVVPDEQRMGFNLRSFMRQWAFDMRKGGGVHMWREKWDEHVSVIYQDILKVPEPRYGRPKKPDPYASLKETKRYIS